ncbi:hypothetical protein D1610_14490 [Sphingomonas gilva]|uniref:SCP domain-containing protein n=1 Tax=Sphingomonas gilva TaxID=2305907 RepID=A0A396RSN0_9SPHN|nr:CAP domain-containing protein [Sphingomonas gilva]RHW16601.1 hypothetical protein D1610_14490 [Sphingomonas gilva]
MLGAAILMMTALAAEAESRPVVFAEESYTRTAARGSHIFTRAMLDQHNRARAEHGLPPLRWNPALAEAARAYAAELAAAGAFEHSEDDGDDPQGENLWMGTREAYGFDEMVAHWVSEKANFRRDAPNMSATGDLSDVGHYTQIVWKDTREVGCGVASDAADDYLVCRYYPAGNVEGEDPLN